MKQRILFSLGVAVAAVLINWLILGNSSPLHEYFLWNESAIEEFWLALNIIPVLLAALISHNPGGGDEVVYAILLFLQWFIAALVVSFFLFRLAGRVFVNR